MLKSCHVGICTISYDEHRANYVDFTRPHFNDEFSMISQNPPIKPPNLVITAIMNRYVWWLLVVFYFLSVWFLLALIKYKTQQITFGNLMAVANILLQVVLSKPIHSHHLPCTRLWPFRFTIIFWALGVLTFVQFLSAALHSVLNFNEYEDYVDTVEALEHIAQTDERLIFTLNLQTIITYFELRSATPLYRKLLEHFDR